MKRTVRPGQTVPASGVYAAPGRRATLDRGEIAPPTRRTGQTWTIVPGTRTNPGRKR
jgi:hypothetical protein